MIYTVEIKVKGDKRTSRFFLEDEEMEIIKQVQEQMEGYNLKSSGEHIPVSLGTAIYSILRDGFKYQQEMNEITRR